MTPKPGSTPRRRSMRASLQHLEAADLSRSEGSVMVKDETICIRCGLCAERCPAHTITMEAFRGIRPAIPT